MPNDTHLLRVEGMNMGSTVFNTTDLSTIRGSSLCLEAVGWELEAWLDAHAADLLPKSISRGGSLACFELSGLDPAAALKLKGDVEALLRRTYDQSANEPPLLDNPKFDFRALPDPVEIEPYLRGPSEHMTFAVEIEAVGDDGREAAFQRAAIRARRRQMRMPNLPRSPGGRAAATDIRSRAAVVCPVDPLRQLRVDDAEGDSTIWVHEDQFFGAVVFDRDTPLKRIRTSKRASDLRTYGRDARRTLYPFQLGASRLARLHDFQVDGIAGGFGLFRTHDFAESFEDIVSDPPDGLPVSLRRKLAFVYLDGNGFSRLQQVVGDMAQFSPMVRELNAEALTELLALFLDGSVRGPDPHNRWSRRRYVSSWSGARRVRAERDLLRLETLIFGGEDMLLVMPGWLALTVVPKLLDALAAAGGGELEKLGKDEVARCTHRAGILICDRHTPARRAAAIAHDLCTDAKAGWVAKDDDEWAPQCLSVHIAEGQDLSELSGALDQRMGQLRGPLSHGLPANEVHSAFRASGGDIANLIEGVSRLKREIPKSRVFELLRDLEDAGASTAEQSVAFRDESDLQAVRGRTGVSLHELRSLLPAPRAPLRLRLRALLEFWDYVDPFEEWREEGEDA